MLATCIRQDGERFQVDFKGTGPVPLIEFDGRLYVRESALDAIGQPRSAIGELLYHEAKPVPGARL